MRFERIVMIVATAAALAGLAFGARVLTPEPRRLPAGRTPLEHEPPDSAVHDPDLLRLAAQSAAFRRDRRNAIETAAEPVPAAELAELAPAAGMWVPPLRISGIVMDTARAAVLEGWSGGEPARLMEPGDERDGVRVLEVHATRVLVATSDTTWTLRLPGPGETQ